MQKKEFPQGEVKPKVSLEKLLLIFGETSLFPMRVKGWVPFAVKAAQKVLNEEISP